MPHNKALHTDKLQLRSFLTTLQLAGELDRWPAARGSVRSNATHLCCGKGPKSC